MLVYTLKRLLQMIPTLLGITFITFLIISLAPGDPVSTSLGAGGGPSADGGGDQNADRMADAIKAKKKLLGMVTEDYSVNAWPAPGGGSVALQARLGELGGWVHSLVLAGDQLAVGTHDGKVLLMDPSTGAVKATLEGHQGGVEALAVSPDGRTLVSGDGKGGLRSWSLPEGTPKATPAPLDRSVTDLAYAGERLLVSSYDGKVRLLDPETLAQQGAFQGDPKGITAIEPSADGERLYVVGYSSRLTEYALPSGEELSERDVHGSAIYDVVLSPDGQRLATAGDDRTAQVHVLADPEAAPVVMSGHFKGVRAVAWTPDSQRIWSGSLDETLRQWDANSGEQLAISAENSGRILALLVTDAGLLSGGDTWKTVPVWKRYIRWLVRIATFDFDRSFVDDRPVMDKIGEALPITLGLNVIALLLIYFISIPLGVYAAMKRNSTFDHISSVALFVLYSVPNFWLATMLIMFLSSQRNFDVLPSVGLVSPDPWSMSYLEWLWDVSKHLVLPVITMVYAGFASLSRYTRTSLLETIGADYVRTARAKGLSETVVVVKHAFRNSLITIVTLVANLLPAMIGGSVIVEYIFTIDGMGRLGFNAILARDYPVIMAITTFSAFLTLLGILVSDLLYSVVDPRVRLD
ncbi:MAG: ABC transporter permease subunit [Alphaproteobacteria bacterium]|nr:ABC transporter permease subunit [Alphaproteobacteria bacterium]MCB9792103.1 ABC transporter permease subunit [Alphaproteobacteria bacterium]